MKKLFILIAALAATAAIANVIITPGGSGGGGSGEANTASNLGASNATVKPVWFDKQGADLRFFSIEAGPNVSISMTPTSLVFSATGGGSISGYDVLTNNNATKTWTNLAATRVEGQFRATGPAIFDGTVGFTAQSPNLFLYTSPGGGLTTLANVDPTELGFVNGVTGPVVGIADPNADRIYFWDDSAGVPTFLDIGSGLQISGTTLSATGGAAAVSNMTTAAVGSLHVTNGVSLSITNAGTNASLTGVWQGGPSIFRHSLSGNTTISLTNLPAAGAPTAWYTIETYDINTAHTLAIQCIDPRAIDWQGVGGPVLNRGATNFIDIYFDGTNFLGSSRQVNYSGSGATVRSNTPTLNLPTINNVKWAMQTPGITVSNILLSFSTNRYYLSGLTNAVLTNWVELAAGESSDLSLYIHNTTGVTMGIVWPAAGSSHGYHFSTNAYNDVRSITSLASGGRLLVSAAIFGTNITPTATSW